MTRVRLSGSAEIINLTTASSFSTIAISVFNTRFIMPIEDEGLKGKFSGDAAEQVSEGVPPTTRAVEVVNVTRDDAVTPTPVREELLDLAPEREGDFLRVPKILAD